MAYSGSDFASAAAALLLLLAGAGAAPAQTWAPDRNIEIVVGSAPGGSNDKTARTVEKALTEKRWVPTSLTVVNKPGGGGSIAWNYTRQHPGDGHYLAVATPSLLTNQITGQSPLSYTELTPIASLLNDYVVFAVRAEGPIRSGRDLIERLKTEPKQVAIGFATALGSHNHIAAGLLARAIGVNARQLKAVAFKGSAEALTALLGGHIDLVTTAAGNAAPHMAAGRLRVVGVAAGQRLGGAFAAIPTWREQGADVVLGGWRGMVGPGKLNAAQVQFWESLFAKVVALPEWKADLEKNFWSDDFATGAKLRADLKQDYDAMRAVLVEIGLAK